MHINLRDDFDMRQVVCELSTAGGSSFSVLPDDLREMLLTEALSYQYLERKKVVGPAGVTQDVSGVDAFPTDNPFFDVRDAWESLLHQKIADLPDKESLFRIPVRFNDLSLQRYEVGSSGITPHLDAKSSINLICVFTLTGSCRFCICQDRDGSNPMELNSSLGNVIILRAPGFRGSDFRPFHFIAAIQGPRISFGLRQRATT